MNRIQIRSTTRFLSCAIVILFAIGSILAYVPARTEAAERQTEEYIAAEDTFAYRDSNNSASQTLVSRYNGGGFERISYLKFDLANLSGAEIERAVFKIYMIRTEGMGDAGIFGLYDNDWSDDTVHLTNDDGTYRRPSEEGRMLLGRYAFNTAGSSPVGAWMEYDLAAYLTDRLREGATTVTLMLKNFSYTESLATAGQGFAYFGSAESANRPTVQVVYSPGGSSGESPAKPMPEVAGISESPPTVTLKWPAAANAVAYTVSRADYESGAFADIEGTFRTAGGEVFFDDAGVQPDRVYSYKIKAHAADASFSESDPLTVTIPPFVGPGDEVAKAYAPTDDAYINQANENAYLNFGNRQDLIVRHNSGFWKRVGYLKFDLGELVGVTHVQKATLKLYLKDAQSGGSMVGLYAIRDNMWSESEITAYEVPSEEGKELLGTMNALIGAPVNTWYEIDITSYINRQFGNHEREISIMLLGGLDAQRSQGYAYFGTKESPNGPSLTIDYIIPDEIPPLEAPKPSVLEATGTNVTLAWPVVPGAAKYNVYRKTEGESQFTLLNVAKTVVNGTVYATDPSADFGMNYEYRIDAIAPKGDALPGEILSVSTTHLDLAAPSGLQADLNKGDALALSWDSVHLATSYDLYRSLDSEGEFERVATVAGTFYEDTGLQLDTAYHYRVQAKRGRYESPLSEAYAVTTEKSATRLTGIMHLESLSDHQGITVSLLDGDVVVKSAVTDESGQFTLYAVPVGSFTLAFSKTAYLRMFADVAIEGGNVDVGAQGELQLGDLNGDDAIDIRDLRLIASAYGNRSSSVDFNALLDLNRDNRIDQADVDRLLQHYGASAERR